MRLTNHEHCENQRRLVQNVARELSSITSSERARSKGGMSGLSLSPSGLCAPGERRGTTVIDPRPAFGDS
jgi:hypothetical protein